MKPPAWKRLPGTVPLPCPLDLPDGHADGAARKQESIEREPACKPDPVPGLHRAVVIHLGPPLPAASSGLPEPRTLRATASAPIWPCSGRGLPSRPRHQGRWWALTPPFHPYPPAPHALRRWAVFLSVALSVGSPRLGVTQLPALRSPDFPRTRPESRPRPPG